MTITVIQQTTEERNQEIQDIYQQCRPLLDQGITLTRALKQLGYKVGGQRWYRDLTKYAESQGYVKK